MVPTFILCVRPARTNFIDTSTGNPECERPHGRTRRKWEDLKLNFSKIVYKGVYWIRSDQQTARCRGVAITGFYKKQRDGSAVSLMTCISELLGSNLDQLTD